MNKRPTENDIKQALLAIYEVSDLAQSIKQLSLDSIEEAGEAHGVSAKLSAIDSLASLAGYNTELAIKKIGGGPGVMSTEQWLCSPRYNDLAKQEPATAGNPA